MSLRTFADQTPLEDTATGAITFAVGDVETAVGTLIVTANSNSQSLIPDVNITLSGSEASRTTDILPGLNQYGGPATITVAVDDGTTTTQSTFDVTDTAANDEPDDIILSANVVDENSTDGTIVGIVSGTDSDVADSLTFSLANNAGGRFAVDLKTGQLTVADGSLLNFGVTSSHGLTVRVADAGGLTYDESFTVSLNDVNEAPSALGEAFSARRLEDLVVPAGILMAKDFDIDGDSLAVVLEASSAEGTLTLAADGSFTYPSTGSFSGPDQFSYYVTDGTLNSEVVTAEIEVAMTISGAAVTPPAESDLPSEPADSTADSEPADASDSENTDESSTDEADMATATTIADTTGSPSEQDSAASAAPDVSAEMLKQAIGEASASIFLTEVPDAGLLDKDFPAQQSESDETVNGKSVEFGLK